MTPAKPRQRGSEMRRDAQLVAGFVMLCLLAAGLGVFVGCGPSIDRGRCLKRTNQIIMQPRYTTVCTNGIYRQQLIGMFPQIIPVCEQWEFPEGRKK